MKEEEEEEDEEEEVPEALSIPLADSPFSFVPRSEVASTVANQEGKSIYFIEVPFPSDFQRRPYRTIRIDVCALRY
jgi:hypothetical protein